MSQDVYLSVTQEWNGGMSLALRWCVEMLFEGVCWKVKGVHWIGVDMVFI